MKRFASFLLVLLLILSLVGCSTPDTPDTSTGATTTTAASTTLQSGGRVTTTTDGGDAESTPAPTQDGGSVTEKPTSSTNKPTAATDKSTSAITAKPTTTTTTKKPTTTTTASGTEQQLVDKAFALTGSATLQATLTGPIISVKEAYNANYGNATFTIRVQGTNGTKELYCYRCKPAGQTDVAVGQTVTLTGTIKNYNGTIEFDKATYTVVGGTTTTHPLTAADIDENGIYDSKEEVALYIHTYGKLPQNYMKKTPFENQGYPKDKCVGGDRFGNYEGLLPSGYTYYECDIDTLGKGKNRGTKRLVYTTSGIVYYTSDHYNSFTQLYGAR